MGETVRTIHQAVALTDARVRRQIAVRLRDDRGEGVISMAIAVLIIAIIGAAMFLIFEGLAEDVGNKATEQIDSIGG